MFLNSLPAGCTSITKMPCCAIPQSIKHNWPEKKKNILQFPPLLTHPHLYSREQLCKAAARETRLCPVELR